MRVFLSMLFSLLLGLSLPVVADPSKTIRLAATEWPPYTGSMLPYNGLAGEIVIAAFARVGHQAEFAVYPWLRAQTMVKNGDLDGMGIAWYTEERAATMAYSRPFLQTDIVLIKHSDNHSESVEQQDMDGKRFSVLRGYGYLDLVASSSIHKTVVDGLQQSLMMVSQKRVDYTLDERLNARHVLKTLPQIVQSQISFVAKPMQTKKLHITISKAVSNHSEIIEDFNRGLQLLIDDGGYTKIIDSYDPRPSGILD